LLKFVRTISEAGWDPSKHPRGGNSQNRGQFSTTGGGEGGGGMPNVVPGGAASASAKDSTTSTVAISGDSSKSPVVTTAQLTKKKPTQKAPPKEDTHTVDRPLTKEKQTAAWERAVLSLAVYDSKDALPMSQGWTRAEKLEGIPGQKKSGGFRAAVYRDPDGNYVVAFAGTDDREDLLDDSVQTFGLRSKQYDEAIRIAKEWKEKADKEGKTIEFVGHSLGGGLASAAAIVTGEKATVFNAAGVHENTISRHFRGADGKRDKAATDAAFAKAATNVTAFRFNGDFLGLQDRPIAGLLAPDTVGTKTTIDSVEHPFKPLRSNLGNPTDPSSVERHKIERLIKALDPSHALTQPATTK
jgi:hypothetical protein